MLRTVGFVAIPIEVKSEEVRRKAALFSLEEHKALVDSRVKSS